MNAAHPRDLLEKSALHARASDDSGHGALGKSSRFALILLGVLSGVAVAVYGLGYVLVLPPVTPEMLRSGSFGSLSLPPWFGATQSAAVLLYSAGLLPVTVSLTIQRYRSAPVAMVIAGTATCLAVLMEIFNNLPVLVQHLYPAKLIAPPAEMLPYLRQTSWIRFAAFDVTAFTLLFCSGLLYAAIFRRERPLLAGAAVGSVVIFIAHLPLLWVAPGLGAGVMGLSICLGACVPPLLASIAVAAPELPAAASGAGGSSTGI